MTTWPTDTFHTAWSALQFATAVNGFMNEDFGYGWLVFGLITSIGIFCVPLIKQDIERRRQQ